MDLWLDDVRPAPEGWVWAKSVDEAIDLLLTREVVDASLDHDLGMAGDPTSWGPYAPDGYDFCKWMAENDVWPEGEVSVHSDNPVGANNMLAILLRYGPFKPSPDPRYLLHVQDV